MITEKSLSKNGNTESKTDNPPQPILVNDSFLDTMVAPTLDTFVRFYPGPVARATGATVDGIFSNFWGNVASIYAQRKALEAK